MSAKSPRTMRVGIDNYGLLPLGLTPLDTLRWAEAHGAEGVAFSGLPPGERDRLDAGALRDLGTFARDHGLYLEWGGAQHIPLDMTTWMAADLLDVNRRAIDEACAVGARVIRSCSGGLMRWSPSPPATGTLISETAGLLLEQAGLFAGGGVVLAIETHFEFTSFELLRIFKLAGVEPGGSVGICLDTMNLLTMLEDPVAASRRLLPWVVSTHVKDGATLLDRAGLRSFTRPVGEGLVDLRAILAMLAGAGREVNLSIEDHGGWFDIPIFDPALLARFPDLSARELARLVEMAAVAAETPACRPLPREAWPAVCEERLARDVAALRAIARSMDPVDGA
jgi:sugar phosphate isomerase/epimerase